MNETYKINLTRNELNVVRVALGRMPYDDVRELIDQIAAQIEMIESERTAKKAEG